MSMLCGKCGKEATAGSIFCVQCGEKLLAADYTVSNQAHQQAPQDRASTPQRQQVPPEQASAHQWQKAPAQLQQPQQWSQQPQQQWQPPQPPLSKKKFPKIMAILIAIAVIAVGAGVWWFMLHDTSNGSDALDNGPDTTGNGSGTHGNSSDTPGSVAVAGIDAAYKGDMEALMNHHAGGNELLDATRRAGIYSQMPLEFSRFGLLKLSQEEIITGIEYEIEITGSELQNFVNHYQDKNDELIYWLYYLRFIDRGDDELSKALSEMPGRISEVYKVGVSTSSPEMTYQFTYDLHVGLVDGEWLILDYIQQVMIPGTPPTQLTQQPSPQPSQPAEPSSGVGFSVSMILPENQDPDTRGYFDIVMTPGQRQNLTIAVSNITSDETVSLIISTVTATTNSVGLINYTDPGRTDVTLIHSFEQISHINDVWIVLAPGEERDVTVSFTAPAQQFDGIILGSITVFAEHGETTGFAANRNMHVTAVRAKMNDNPVPPDFLLGYVTVDHMQDPNAFVVEIRNTQARLSRNAEVYADIYTQNDFENGRPPTYQTHITQAAFAPNSVLPLTISDNRLTGIPSWTYVVVIRVELEGTTWEWEFEFEHTMP